MNNQKQIEELEATIQKAQQQIEGLKKPKWAESIKDVKGRNWFIDENGEIDYTGNTFLDKNNFSNSERAKAFLALGQLRELHADINSEELNRNYGIDIGTINFYTYLFFKTEEQLDYFRTQHAELIRIVEEGI